VFGVFARTLAKQGSVLWLLFVCLGFLRFVCVYHVCVGGFFFFFFTDTKIRILREVVDTERAYVQSLNLLINQYELPLRELVQKKKMPVKETLLTELFGPVRMILDVNKHFLASLEREVVRKKCALVALVCKVCCDM
jgi:RhoGEF domain